jgi:hypothetical protein
MIIIFSFTISGISQENNISENTLDTSQKEIRFSLGAGIATYHKDGILLSADMIYQFNKKFYIGFAADYFHILKSGRSPYKISSFSMNALYKGELEADKVHYFVGGGILTTIGRSSGFPFALNGFAKVDYKFADSFAIGITYKQPLFVGIDISAPPLMLLELSFSYIVD